MNLSEFVFPIEAADMVAFCPRAFYFGSARRKRRREFFISGIPRDVKLPSAGKVSLRAQKFNVFGTIDVLSDRTRDYPLVYVQPAEGVGDAVGRVLSARAALMESALDRKNITAGFALYSGEETPREIAITRSMKNQAAETLDLMWEIFEGDYIPPPVDDFRCTVCPFAEVCLPDEVNLMLNGVDATPSRRGRKSQVRRMLYVDEPFAKISFSSGKIVVSDENKEELAQIPVELVDRAYLAGNILITDRALQEFMKRDIYIAMFSSRGKFEGMFIPERSRDVSVRIEQVKRSEDENFRVNVAKKLVLGKIKNECWVVFRRLRGKYRRPVRKIKTNTEKFRRMLIRARTIDEILGIEGFSTKLYFSFFDLLIENPRFSFEGRTRRPPLDEMNAMLSYGYTLLTSELVGICYAVGLDPYIGIYHRSRYGSPALALDLIEEFRAPLVDSLVLKLVNQKIIRPDDFYYKERPYKAVYLNRFGRKKFFKYYNDRLNVEITHPLFGKRYTWRRILEIQARLMAKVITGEIDEYPPFIRG